MRIFHQRWADVHGSEVVIVDGARRQQSPLPGLVERKRGIVASVRAGIGVLVRRSAQLLLLAPVAIVPKLILPRAASDVITVGFVIAVVAFFTLLALYFLVSFAWWAVRDRERKLIFRWPELDERERRALLAGDATAPPGSMVRLCGRVVPLIATDVVLRAFAADAEAPWRLVELVEFAVVPPQGIPVVVRVLTAPVLALAETRGSFREHAAGFSEAARGLVGDPAAPGRYAELLPGARVEIIGSVEQTLPNAGAFELDGKSWSLADPDAGAGAAYRGGPSGPALLLGRDHSPRIVIRSAR